MRCASLTELPPPPPGRAGWPWTAESGLLPDRAPDGSSWPRVTVVTPSFNQGQFIEETIRSVLLQGYPNLEYFVLDGGSRDGTVEIIEKYARWIDFWVSEPDGGQSAAINRGLRLGSGSHATWINSDDMLSQNALTTQLLTRGLEQDVIYAGDCTYVDAAGRTLFTHRGRVRSFEDLVRVPSVWRADGCIDQPAVLFPLPLALRVGALDERSHHTMDYELWGRLLLAGATIVYTEIPVGIFRCHEAQKTHNLLKQTNALLDAAEALIRQPNPLPTQLRLELLQDLHDYRADYPAKLWKESGRLARLGLPESIVMPLRKLKGTLKRGLGAA
jgi:glycosyltransferase involved in cell wall biosynthesis